MLRLSNEQRDTANQILSRMDKLAAAVQANYSKWGLDFKQAKELVHGLDRVADETEQFIFGGDSLLRRQAEIAVQDPDFAKEAQTVVGPAIFAKAAKVLQRDSDEPYMDSFNSITKPIETDADEPYMQTYADDQSSAVIEGEDETGRELAP